MSDPLKNPIVIVIELQRSAFANEEEAVDTIKECLNAPNCEFRIQPIRKFIRRASP